MQTRFNYVRCSNVHKTIQLKQGSTSELQAHAPIPSIFHVFPAVLDFYDEHSRWEFTQNARILGTPTFYIDHMGKQVVSMKRQAQGGHNDAVTRTQDRFAFLPGPGLMFIDCDLKDAKSSYRSLRELGIPDDIMRMEYYSSSSHIYYEGYGGRLAINEDKGRHIIIAVENAADIPAMGAALYDRAWLMGAGYAYISKAGHVLLRSFIDGAVWQPERLVFGAPTIQGPGLHRTEYLPAFNPGRLARLEDFAITEQHAGWAQSLRDQAKAEAEASPEAQSAARAFAMASPNPGETLEETMIRNKRFAGLGMLPPYLRIQTAFGIVPVRDIYANFDRFYDTECPDPLEPHYGNDSRIAKFVRLRGGRPAIYSHAHGGQEWLLMPALLADDFVSVIEEDPYVDEQSLARM